MDKDYLIELLKNYRADKAHIWNSLIVSVSGTIGLIIRAFNIKNNSLEILLIAIGVIFTISMFYFISEFNYKINYVMNRFKRGENIE